MLDGFESWLIAMCAGEYTIVRVESQACFVLKWHFFQSFYYKVSSSRKLNIDKFRVHASWKGFRFVYSEKFNISSIIVSYKSLSLHLFSKHDKAIRAYILVPFSCLLLQFAMPVNKGCKMSPIIADLGELNIPPGWSAGCVRSCECGCIYTSERQHACVYRSWYLRLQIHPQRIESTGLNYEGRFG